MKRQSFLFVLIGMMGLVSTAHAQPNPSPSSEVSADATREQVIQRKREAMIEFMEAGRDADAGRSNRSVIYVKSGAGGSGSSWANAYGNLHDALLNASSGDDIWVAAGTYVPNRRSDNEFDCSSETGECTFGLVTANVRVLGGFPNTGNPGLADRNPFSHETILDGIGNRWHIMVADTSTILDGFTLMRGHAFGNFFDDTVRGGALALRAADVTVINCKFIDNDCNQDGGAVFGFSSGLTFINCQFINNTSADQGGAVSVGDTDFINCLFVGNQILQEGSDGGAINMGGGSITNCTFVNNTVPAGRGAAVAAQSSNVTIRNSIFWGSNQIKGTCGGFGCNDDNDCFGDTCDFGDNLHIDGTSDVQFCLVEGGIAGTGNISSDPQFENAGSGDYRLGGGSPARDAGSNSAVPNPVVVIMLTT